MFVSRASAAVRITDKAVEPDRCDLANSELARVGVSRLAVDVMARLAAREDGMAGGVPNEGFVEKLRAAVRGSQSLSLGALLSDMRRARINRAALADVYIPQVARLLGREWEEDSLSFAEVTIGVARLQALLREVSAVWGADDCQSGHGLSSPALTSVRGRATRFAALGIGFAHEPMVLVVVPGDEQHTLGPMVLTSQLRRMGISVCLRLQPTPAIITALLRNRRFDGAIVSVGGQGKLEAAQTMVKLLKSLTDGQLQVAVGGAAVEKIKMNGGIAGADVMTNDLPTALRILGVNPATIGADERV